MKARPEPSPIDAGISDRELLTLMSAVMAVMALGIDLLLPAFDEIREAYGLEAGSNTTGQLLTVFFFGLAIAQLFYGPLADRYGRKAVLWVGIGIYIVGAVGSALAPTFGSLLVMRFVWGVGAAGARVVAVAIIRDRFVGDAMARAMSQVMAVFVLVPVVAPTLGAGLIAIFPWQSVFWACVVWGVLIVAWSTRLNETLRPEHVRPLNASSSLSAYAECARTPVTFGYTVAGIFVQGVMTTYLAVSELIISDMYDREGQFPFIFGLIALGFGGAALVNGWLVERMGTERMLTVAFAIGVPVSALMVVASAASDGLPPFWLLVALLAGLLASFMLAFPNLGTAAMMPVGHIAGSASAFTGAVRTALGAALAAVAIETVTDSVTPFAVAAAVFTVCAALTVFAVRVRGRARRSATTDETSAVTV